MGIDRKLLGAVAAGVVLIAVLASGLYLLSTHDRSATSAESPRLEAHDAQNTSSSAQPEQSASDTVTVTIDAIGGTAKVYQDGNFLNDTPCPISAHIGETVNVELRRDGFEPYRDSFTVTAQTKTKSFRMQPSEEADSP